MRYAKIVLLTLTWTALLGFSYFALTGQPESLHLWWDSGNNQCFSRCKICGGCQYIVVGIHDQAYHHPRLHAAGICAAGAAISLSIAWVLRKPRPAQVLRSA